MSDYITPYYETVEEILSELSQALCKVKEWEELYAQHKADIKDVDKLLDNVAEEIADVEIMIAQCKMIYECHNEVDEWKRKKIERLKERLKNDTQLLKPCPFCGMTAMSYREHSKLGVAIECGSLECSAMTRYFPTKELAIEAWNRRAENAE